MTAGTEHPNPRSRGMKARPERPRRLMMSSMTKATRDMYPLSSSMASARNRMKMLGRKVRMPPTPEMMPSTIREVTMGPVPTAARPSDTRPEKASSPISK